MYSDFTRVSIYPHGIGAGYDDINSSTRRYGISFTAPPTAETLNGIKLVFNVTGTPTAQVDVYAADAFGLPTGASLDSSTTFAFGTGTTTTTITGLSEALTPGARYFLLFQNTHGTPGSNYFSGVSYPYTPRWDGWGNAFSDDSGTVWRSVRQEPHPMCLTFASGARWGFANLRVNVAGSVGLALHGNNRSGVRIKLDSHIIIDEVEVCLRQVGTFASAGSIHCELYDGTTLKATSGNSVTTTTTTGQNGFQGFSFDASSLGTFFKAGTTIGVMLHNSGGSASHHYHLQGSAVNTYAPTGVDDCIPYGYHSVRATTEPLSAYAIEGSTAQYWMRISGRIPSPEAFREMLTGGRL